MEQKEIGIKDLTCKEIAEIWENRKGENGFNVNTIKGYIRKLCDMEMGLKKEYFIVDGVYTVKKEIQGLFFCLIDSSLLKKKNKRSVLYNGELNHELLENIDKWLDEEDKEKIKNNPIYRSMKHNDTLVREYFNSWWKLNEVIFSADTYTRHLLIKKTWEIVQKICILMKRTKVSLEIQKEKWKDICLPTERMGSVIEGNLVNLLVGMMAMKLNRDEEKRILEKAGWIKDGDKSFELISNVLFPPVKPEDIEKRRMHVIQKHRTRCEGVKKRIEKVFSDRDEETIKNMVMDLLDICYSLPEDDLKKFSESFYEEKGNWEEVYLDFFINYQEIQNILEDIRSEEYKRYMEYKEDERFKKLLLQLKTEKNNNNAAGIIRIPAFFILPLKNGVSQ